MRTQPATQEDSSAAITPPIRPRMPWRVAEVQAMDGYCLHVRFIDGLEGEVDMAALIHSLGAGVFARLADPELFSRASVEYGVVVWPGEIDLAPDAMYAEIKKTGIWKI